MYYLPSHTSSLHKQQKKIILRQPDETETQDVWTDGTKRHRQSVGSAGESRLCRSVLSAQLIPHASLKSLTNHNKINNYLPQAYKLSDFLVSWMHLLSTKRRKELL